MKLNLINVYALTICFCACKNYSTQSNSEISNNNAVATASNYPLIIDSLNLHRQFDKAKWLLYCIHCDDTLNLFNDSSNQQITFGVLPLRLDTLQTMGDSVEIDLRFYYKDTIPCDENHIRNTVTWGVVFKKSTDSVICFSSTSIMRYFQHKCLNMANCRDRFVSPLQPEVIAYLKNQDHANSWFVNEAKKRGVSIKD